MLSGKNLYFVQNIVVNMIKSIDTPAENSVPLYVFLPGSHSSFGMKRRSRKKKINTDVQDWVTSFRVFFSSCVSSVFAVLEQNMGWQNIVHTSTGTVRYCQDFGKKKKKKVGQIMKTVLPVDHVLFHLGLLSQNATEKDPQHVRWTCPLIGGEDCCREKVDF